MNWPEYIIVGAGISGLTIARKLFDAHKSVLIIEKEKTIGGLCQSYFDEKTGIECHSHGTHIFHTSDPSVYQFISRFCILNQYQHKVFAKFNQKTYPIPINLQTINLFYNLDLNPKQAKNFLHMLTRGEPPGDTLENTARLQIGYGLYRAFIESYTYKQWGISPLQLPGSIIKRIPARTDYRNNYFDDVWQGLPLNGYPDLFSKMSDGIPVQIGTDFFEIRNEIPPICKIVYTGPLDKFFDYKFGKLPWRSSRFEFETHSNLKDFQGCAVMNYPERTYLHIRIHEFRHLHPERKKCSFRKTITAKEYSIEGNETPSYPIDPESTQAHQYRELSNQQPRTFFCGRLGTYRYLNMDMAILDALNLSQKLIGGAKWQI